MSDNITPYEAQEKLKSIGVPANTGDREAAVEYFQEHFGVEPIEVIRAVGDDDVFLALNYLARQYDLYNRKEYKSGGEIENYLKERYANSSEEQLEMSYEDYDELVDRIRREYKVASDEAHNIADELLDGYGVQVFAKGGSTYSKGGRVDVDLSSIGLKGHFEYDVVNGLAKVYDIYYVSKNGGYTLVRQTTENPNDFIVGYIDYLQGRDGRYLLEKLKKQDTYAKGGSTYSNGGEIKQTAKGAKIASLFERSNEIQRSGFGRGYSKGDLMKLAYGSNYSNVDSALPMGALEAHGIEPMQRYRYVMDYNENSFGEIVDLYEKIAERNPTVEVFNADYVLEGEHPINEAYEKFYKNSKFPYFIQATGSDRFEKGGSTYARGGEIEVGDTVYHAVYTDDDGEKYAIIIVADSKKEAEEYAESVEGEAFTFIRDGVKIKDDEHLNNHLGLIEGSKVVRLDSTYSKGGGVSGWFKGDLSCLNW